MTEDARPTEPTALLPVVRTGLPGLPASVQGPLDVALGAGVVVARPLVGAAGALAASFGPLVRDTVAIVARPPLVPAAWTPAALAERLAATGRTVRVAGAADAEVAGGQALDALVPVVLERVLDRVDLTNLVLQRVELGRLVEAVLDRMDLTDVVLSRVDLDPIVDKALEGMDLTDVVLTRVDLDRIITAALDGMDLNELVRTRVDLAGIAEEVIDDVDLPEIIRDSTAGVASVVVDGTRLRAVQGDELVNRLVDRILLRRKARRTAAPEGSLDTATDAWAPRLSESAQRAEEDASRSAAAQADPPSTADGAEAGGVAGEERRDG